MAPPKPIPFDPEMIGSLKANGLMPAPPPPTKEDIQARRDMITPAASHENVFKDPDMAYSETTIPGPDGNTIELTIVETKSHIKTLRPGIFYLHGGGMILGTRNFLLEGTFPWIKELNAVLVTPEYRLAPENQYPAIIEDCYTGLKWFSQNTAKLGIDPNRVIIAGHSAGGGLAAGMALLARDRKLELKLCAQLLVYPMLDDRMTAASCQQFMDKGTWTGKSNRVAWDWILGDKARKGDEVGKELMYIAPARAEDLSGLPTAWVECGSAEPFRDEDVLYATRLWEAGVQCELHVWAGGFHGYDVFAADSAIAKVSFEARLNWLRRVMGPAPNPKASL